MTKLLYLDDTYTFQSSAIVTDIRTIDDGRAAVILDQTIFYPQGGGQPCDVGTISSANSTFTVTDVRLDKDGTVFHMGTFENGTFAVGDAVKLVVDRERRLQNTKAHSAGHLIDCAVTQLGLQLKPAKGYHFPQGPYVEYEGELENTPEMIQKLQAVVDELVGKPLKVIAHEISAEDAAQQGMMVPAGKKARMVCFEGFAACGCGGTHVRDAGELGAIHIRKIKVKHGITKISYEVK